jgi:uncharacterized protein (DUF433 family)
MARYPLNLPMQLKREAEEWARRQGVSLNQFILWATAEKVGALSQQLDDEQYPNITYRRGASGTPAPILRGSGIRVQTIVTAVQAWQMTEAEISEAYRLSERQVAEALAFYEAHREEIDQAIELELVLEAGLGLETQDNE